jgi:hypothetical protein
MASNNVTTDWQSVKNSAVRELLDNERKLSYFVDITLFGLFKQRDASKKQLAAAKAALATATANKQDTTAAQAALTAAQNEVSRVAVALTAAEKQEAAFEAKSDSLRASIAEAETQIARQAAGTTPATNTRIAATVTPASAQPGNPNVATTPTPAQNAAPTKVIVPSNSVAAGSTKAVPSPSTAEARPATPPAKIVKPTKTVSTTRTVTVSDGIPEVLKTAPQGAQWNRPGSPDGKVKAQNLRKVGPNQYVAFASGGAPIKLDAAGAAKFFRDKQYTNCNMPQFMPKKVTKKITEKKTVTDTKGAPKKTEEKAKKEELPPFDASDILLAQSIQSGFDQANFEGYDDWRVRLSLAPNSNYLYAGTNPGILQPLQATQGVVFPYTPQIVVNYQANYNPIDLVHTNYKVFQYTNSSVDQVTITCEFTAQDVYEARYLLATIHFFKTMTKMFYGQDTYPVRGTPPPLCYMFGMGGYQFSAHPLAINSFNYNLPNDVDYIKTTAPVSKFESNFEDSLNTLYTEMGISNSQSQDRLGEGLKPGGTCPAPKFNFAPKDITTWVPTKIQLSIGCIPIMSRNQVSNYFSLNDYASGYLVKGTTRPGGGMW